MNPPGSEQAASRGRCGGLCWPKPAQRLLLGCLHLPHEKAVAAYRAWRACSDIDTLDAGSLALMPLLGVRLAELGVGDGLGPLLAGAHRRSWCLSQLLIRGALEALDRLAVRKIPFLPLKGLPLLDCYADLGLRPMGDVDVLVPRERALETFDVLVRAGFELRPTLSRSALAAKMEVLHGWSVGQGRIEIDVHWASLLEDLSPDGDVRLWSRARAGDVAGHRLLRPSSTDLLFHVCVHGARWSRIQRVTWVVDSMHLLARARGEDGIDWSLLVAEAKARALQIPLGETLRFLREVLGAEVPEGVLLALEPPEPAWLYWRSYHAHSANPRKTSALHRAAVRIVAKLRAGETVEGLTLRSPSNQGRRESCLASNQRPG